MQKKLVPPAIATVLASVIPGDGFASFTSSVGS
jgi:hypothetical protein